jgi:signal transduction histidine kinase
VAQGHLELAGEDCDSEHLADVGRALERMDGLISDLLTLARQSNTTPSLSSLDLEGLVRTSWDTVATAQATLETDLNRTLRADESRVRQLFENLIRNAVEHGGDDVAVTIGELPDGFYVEDDGPGIPAGERGDVFEAGYSTQADSGGFGLRIVAQVVDDHGWDIEIREGAAGGARFEITGVDFVAE